MRRRPLLFSTSVVLAVGGFGLLENGCAGNGDDLFHQGGGTATPTSGGGGSSSGGSAGHGAGPQGGSGGSAAHGGTTPQGGGGAGAQGGTGPQGGGGHGAQGAGGSGAQGGQGGSGAQGGQGGTGPCDSSCSAVEQCDGIHAGIDDNCNGVVDEGCPCIPGQAEACFKGDPQYRDAPGCFAGTQHCTAQGQWGPCIGGVHANAQCYQVPQGCHAIAGYPLAPVNLKTGTGTFSLDALSESWTVDCPPGSRACPGVFGSAPADDFQPLQSGEYTVHYSKQTANGAASCSYPLFVGFTGLRVELDWEHGVTGPADAGVDLDLHVHKPQDTSVWGGNMGTAIDCAWTTCVVSHYNPAAPDATAPDWFSGVAPPDPVDWYLDPVFARNTCYYAPRGLGTTWQGYAHGCHNPRLELDNISCTSTVTDPNNQSFCAPENTNIDYPPQGQWFRLGVHYYSSAGVAYDVHPRVLVFCGGELAAELGPQGYNAPVTFHPADGTDPTSNVFWLVGDVRFVGDGCNPNKCEVRPLYADQLAHTPLLSNATAVTQSFTPPYPN